MKTGLGRYRPHLPTAGGFTPTDITGLAAWYDASNAGSITASSGAVSQWNDLSGNALHLTQGTGAKQPTTGTRTQNSLNVIDFDGGDWLGMNLAVPATARFICAVQKLDATTNERTWFGNQRSDGYEWRVATTAGTGQDILEAAVAHHIPTGQTAASTTASVLAMQWTTTTMDAYLNGAHDGSQLAHSFSFTAGDTFNIIGTDRIEASSVDGWLAELVVVEADVSSGDRAALFAYLNAKWAVY